MNQTILEANNDILKNHSADIFSLLCFVMFDDKYT